MDRYPVGREIPEPIHRPAGINRMTEQADTVLPMSQPARGAVLGAVSCGTLGAIVGLLGGLYAYAPTAPFAMIELGLPASIMGAIVGLIIGSILAVGRRLSRNDH